MSHYTSSLPAGSEEPASPPRVGPPGAAESEAAAVPPIEEDDDDDDDRIPIATFSLATGRSSFLGDEETPTRSHEELEHHTRDELLSQINNTDAPSSSDSACAICVGEREITLQFGGCSHAACGPCTEGIWYSRQQHDGHFPTWITCHMCRAEVSSVGVLSRAPTEAYFGEEIVHGEEVFTVWGWQGIRRWMAVRRESVGSGLSRSGRGVELFV